MATKEIFLIRHGQTDYNLRGVVQGSGINSDLNATGRAQAAAFYEKYMNTPFKAVYTSALKRTSQSVEGFLAKNIPHSVLEGLNEISWGHKEGRQPNIEDDLEYCQLMEDWRNGITTSKIRGGESPEEVIQRQIPAWNSILANEKEDIVLVAMHGRAMRILLTYLCKVPLSEMDSFKHENLCLYHLKYHYKTETTEILLANDLSHLELISVA